jgi:hypothetical protein
VRRIRPEGKAKRMTRVLVAISGYSIVQEINNDVQSVDKANTRVVGVGVRKKQIYAKAM